MKRIIIDGEQTNYFVDEQGNIFNQKTQKYLKGTIRSGYKMVKLTINKIKRDYCIHRLVAEAFLDNPKNLPQVNHIDRNKLNNNVNNLEWVNASDNIKHCNQTGKNKRQKINPINEEISERNGWKQFKDSNYWFNKDGRGCNIKTKKYLNTSMKNDGYLRYFLYLNRQRKVYLAHRLIYEVFNGEIKENYQINHIDGNKQNNHIDNLEMVTGSQNMQHSFYVLKNNVKSVLQYDLNGDFIKEYPSMSQAAKELSIDVSGISLACNKHLQSYKGYLWKIKNR